MSRVVSVAVTVAIAATITVVAGTVPVSAAPPPKPVVYLTFDDGPIPTGTNAVLDVLARHDVEATFFLLGYRVEQYPDVVARILREGHAVGGHSYDHPNYAQSSEATVAWQMDRTMEAIRAAGGPTISCHRAPYGNSSTVSRRLAAERGLAELYWNIDPRDYQSSSSSIVAELNRVRDGDVVVLHDGSSNYRATVAALDSWLGANRDRFDFQSLPACTGGLPGPRSVYGPIGAVDRTVVSADGVEVVGWTLDWDMPDRSNLVHVYVDGRFAAEARASSRRPDVAAATGGGERHGFAVFVPTGPGEHEVCVYGLGLDSAGRYDARNAPLGGCQRIRVGSGAPAAPAVPSSGPPLGQLDLVAAGGGILEAVGWTFDPDDPGRSVHVHLYVDGAFRGEWRADRVRPDVNDAKGVSGRHGFSIRTGIPAGAHDVCVYALGVDGSGRLDGVNPPVGCRRVSSGGDAPTPGPSASPFAPEGHVDRVVGQADSVEIAAWAADRDSPSSAVTIHVYVDGVYAGGRRASAARPDVNAALGLPGDHGFGISIPASAGRHEVCVYALGLDSTGSENGENRLLSCQRVDVGVP